MRHESAAGLTNQLRSYFYGPEIEIAALWDGSTHRGGASAMVAEGVLHRRGEFHVGMWLEKTSVWSDGHHTCSAFKNYNMKRVP